MKAFYTAKNFSGETKSGEASIVDERDLASQLRSEGFVLTSFSEINEVQEKKTDIHIFDRFFSISVSAKMIFARNLSVMISSGLPLSRAISNIIKQTQDKAFVKILTSIEADIQTGATLSDGMQKYPGVFGELFVNMIRVGETGGNLEEVLNILATQLEKEDDLLKKVKGAMVYPAVILVAMFGIGILMMVYVVPQITSVFNDLNAELPATTKFIIWLSEALQKQWWAFIVFAGIFGFAFKFAMTTEIGRKYVGFILVNIPVVKNIVIKLNCARFARIYSSLLKSGVSVVEALKILSKTLTNYYYKNAFEKSVESVQKGESLSSIIFNEKKIFPILVPQMIEVGEETGKTEAVLLKLAEFYEGEVDQLTKNLSSIIEPVLMLLIGSAVGFFAISILQPMYSVLENIN